MSKYVLGNNNLKEIQHGSQPLFGNLAWLQAKIFLLSRKCSVTKFCYLELSQQQASCCRVLSQQQVELISYREHTCSSNSVAENFLRDKYTCCRGSSQQQNFMNKYVLGNNIRGNSNSNNNSRDADSVAECSWC